MLQNDNRKYNLLLKIKTAVFQLDTADFYIIQFPKQ